MIEHESFVTKMIAMGSKFDGKFLKNVSYQTQPFLLSRQLYVDKVYTKLVKSS